jgi:DNA mismatch endonuclease (patch repair protein)
MGFRYRKNRRDVIGTPDLAFIGQKKAIFMHGCFWHRHDCKLGARTPKSKADFWSKKFEANVRRDAAVARELKANDWRALIVWECELRDQMRVRGRIERFLNA